MKSDSENNYNMSFELPTRVIMEWGILGKLSDYLNHYQLKKILLITTEGALKRMPSVVASLEDNGHPPKMILYVLNSGFKASTDELHKLKQFLKKDNFDSLISIGGGNVLDFAKAAAVCFDDSVKLDALFTTTVEHVEKKLFHIAIPTTFGTGSEVTKGAIILDNQSGNKEGLRGKAIFPDITLIDPSLGNTLPDDILRETLFDSFTHSFEAIQAMKENRIIHMFAEDALLLFNDVVEKYHNKDYQNQFYSEISYISLLGGICVCHNSTCLPHRFEQAFSPIYTLSHGAGLSAFYPAWVHLLEHYGVAQPLSEKITQGKSLSEYVSNIITKLKLNTTAASLKTLDLKPEDVLVRIKGNISNDPLVNKIGENVIEKLMLNYLGKSL